MNGNGQLHLFCLKHSTGMLPWVAYPLFYQQMCSQNLTVISHDLPLKNILETFRSRARAMVGKHTTSSIKQLCPGDFDKNQAKSAHKSWVIGKASAGHKISKL